MPDTDNPVIEKWLPALQAIISNPDKILF